MNAVGLVDAVRTSFGRRGGGLASHHPAEMLGTVLSALLARTDVPPDAVDAVVCGCAEKTGEQGFNIARTAWLTAGLPPHVPGITVDAQCGSSHEAVTLAHAMIGSGLAEVVIACGVESMSRVPLGHTFFAGPGKPIPDSYLSRYPSPDQFKAAEALAARYGITRAACDDLAALSNQRAESSQRSGAFDSQLVAINGIIADECVRPVDRARMAALDPISPGAVHTKASASKVADGASALLLMSEARARAESVAFAARILDSTLVGVDPAMMLSGPIAVTHRLLSAHQLRISDIDLFEINEAFASVVLAWAAAHDADLDRVNPDGGALALGHPIGASGTALVAKAVHALARKDKELALVSMCCGGGLGTGTLIARGDA